MFLTTRVPNAGGLKQGISSNWMQQFLILKLNVQVARQMHQMAPGNVNVAWNGIDVGDIVTHTRA